MAYTRHSHGSNWYIFPTGDEPDGIDGEQLAVYHVSAMEPGEHPNQLDWRYAELKEMMRNDDFSSIPGAEDQPSLLVDCIRRFIEVCETEWSEREAAQPLPRGGSAAF